MGRVLLPVGLLFSLFLGTCWYGLWGLSAAGFQGWGEVPFSQPSGWLKRSETQRR